MGAQGMRVQNLHRQDLRRQDLRRHDLHRHDLHRHDLCRHDLRRQSLENRSRRKGNHSPRVGGLRTAPRRLCWGPWGSVGTRRPRRRDLGGGRGLRGHQGLVPQPFRMSTVPPRIESAGLPFAVRAGLGSKQRVF